MINKYFLLFIVSLLCVGFVSGNGYVYQETANSYTNFETAWYDGDYDTNAHIGSTEVRDAYANYTIPANAVGATLYLKEGHSAPDTYTTHTDIVIPSNCTSGDNLIIKIHLERSGGNYVSGQNLVYCYDGSGYFQILDMDLDFGYVSTYGVYEEGVLWNISDYSISAYSEWDNSAISTFSANITGYPYLSPYTVALYYFNWTTNDSARINDGELSGYTLNDGTISGATTGVTGVYGEGVSFDGTNDKITASELTFSTEMSFDAWVYVNNDGVNYKPIIVQGTGSTSTTTFYLDEGLDGKVRFFINYDTGSSRIDSSVGILSGWHHVAGVAKTGDIKLYIDGVVKASATTAFNSIDDVNESVYLGNGRGTSNWFNGSLDEVRIYDFALTPTQVNESMNSHFPVEKPVLSYSFEAYATHVFDTNWNVQGQDEAETGAISFDGTQTVLIPGFDLTENHSISLWYNKDTLANSQALISYGDNNGITVRYDANRMEYYVGNSLVSYTGVTAGTWHHLVATANSTHIRLYEDGVLKNTAAQGAINYETYTKISISGMRDGAIYKWIGSLSEVQIFDRALSADEVGYLYDSQAITYQLSTSDGKVETQIPNSSPNQYNITVAATDYFPQSFSSQATSSNLSVYFNQSIITFDSFELYTGDQLSATEYNISNGTTTKTVSEGGSINLKVGSYNVTSIISGYFNKTYSFSVSSLEQKTENITGIYDYILTIVFKDQANSTITNSTVINLTGTYNNLSNTTTAGSITYNTLIGIYDFTTLPNGYALNSFSINSSDETTPINQTYYDYHYTTNSIQFYFRDEITKELITTDNISVELISDSVSYDYNTSNGTLYVDIISPEDYNIRYKGNTYGERNYFFTMSDYSFNNITLYLLANTSTAQEVTITLYDTLQNIIEGAKITTLKYDVDTNAYTSISTKETNFQGKITEDLFINSEYYKFIVEYNGDTILTTNPTYVLDTSITLYANLLNEGFSQMFNIHKLYGLITYNNNTNILSYTYYDGNGVASGGCFYAYRNTINGQTLVNSTCGVGAANTLYLTVDNTTGYSYEIKGYITRDGNNYYVTNLLLNFDDEIPSSDDNIILVIIMIVTLVFIGFWKLEVAVIMAGLGTMLMSIIGILSISITYTIPIFVLSIVAAFIINKGKGG